MACGTPMETSTWALALSFAPGVCACILARLFPPHLAPSRPPPHESHLRNFLRLSHPREHSVSRQAQDEYAAESFARAKSALTAGAFDPEIVPVQARPSDDRSFLLRAVFPRAGSVWVESLTRNVRDPLRAGRPFVQAQVTKGKTVTTVAKDETAAKGSTLEGLAKCALFHERAGTPGPM